MAFDFTKDYARSQIGNVVTPLSTTSGNTLLQDADPTIFFALDFFSGLIRIYEEARLLQAATAAGMTNIGAAVAQRYPWVPELETQQNQFQFPLMAMYRKDATTTQLTTAWEDDKTDFDLVYVLPPMTAAQTEQIAPVLNAIAGTLRKGATRGFDPNYTPPGGSLGSLVWGAAGANFEWGGFSRWHYLTWPAASGLKFPCLLMEGTFVERDMYVQGTNKFAGADTEVDVVAGDGTIVTSVINTSTQQAPTITTVSPSTGPVAGGTSVTITGSLFLQNPVVYFGVARAWSVTWNSATSLTVTSPTYGNAGSVDVFVTNVDGQGAVANRAFTYV